MLSDERIKIEASESPTALDSLAFVVGSFPLQFHPSSAFDIMIYINTSQ